jgi:hypothetical protein
MVFLTRLSGLVQALKILLSRKPPASLDARSHRPFLHSPEVERDRDRVPAVLAAKPAQEMQQSRRTVRLFPLRPFHHGLNHAVQNVRRDAAEEFRQRHNIANGSQGFRTVDGGGQGINQLVTGANYAAQQIQHAVIVQELRQLESRQDGVGVPVGSLAQMSIDTGPF